MSGPEDFWVRVLYESALMYRSESHGKGRTSRRTRLLIRPAWCPTEYNPNGCILRRRLTIPVLKHALRQVQGQED